MSSSVRLASRPGNLRSGDRSVGGSVRRDPTSGDLPGSVPCDHAGGLGSLDMVAVPDFSLLDQAGEPWTLSPHRDSAVLLVFLRGDW